MAAPRLLRPSGGRQKVGRAVTALPNPVFRPFIWDTGATTVLPYESIGLRAGRRVTWFLIASKHPSQGNVQADIGCGEPRAVVFGYGDFKRRALIKVQRAAHAQHDARVGERRHA